MLGTRWGRRSAGRLVGLLVVLLIGAACSGSGSGDGTPTAADEDIPTQSLSYTYLPGFDDLAWIRDNAELIMTAGLVEIRPEVFSHYEAESMDDIERVYRGFVFEPIEVLKGEPPAGEVIVLDASADRDRFSKKKTAYLISDAYPMAEQDIGETFALFLSELPTSWGAPDAMFGFVSGRYAAVLVRANGTVEVHRPDDTSNPWLAYESADLDTILADLGLSGS